MFESKGDVKSTSSTVDELKAVSRRVVPKGFYDFTLVGSREPYAPPTIVGFMEYSDPRCPPGPRLHLRNAPGMGVEGAARSLVFDNVDREMTWRQLLVAVMNREWVLPSTIWFSPASGAGPHGIAYDDAIFKGHSERQNDLYIPMDSMRKKQVKLALRVHEDAPPLRLANARFDRKWLTLTDAGCPINVLRAADVSLRPSFEFQYNDRHSIEGFDESAKESSCYSLWEVSERDGSASPVPLSSKHGRFARTLSLNRAYSQRVISRPKQDLRCGVTYAFCVNDWSMFEYHARARDFPLWRETVDALDELGARLPVPVLSLIEGYVSVDSPPLMRTKNAGDLPPSPTLAGYRVFFRLEQDTSAGSDADAKGEAGRAEAVRVVTPRPEPVLVEVADTMMSLVLASRAQRLGGAAAAAARSNGISIAEQLADQMAAQKAAKAGEPPAAAPQPLAPLRRRW